MKKVLILPSWYPSDRHPINGIFIQDQAALLASSYRVAVLSPTVVGWRDILRGRAGKAFVEQREGLPVYREIALTPLLRFPALAHWSYDRAVQRGFEKLLTGWGRPDIIHAHVVLPAGWAAVRLGRRYGIPVVLTEHSSPFSVHLRTGYQRRLVRETLSQVNRVISVSPALEQRIRAFQEGLDMTVIGELVKTRFFVPGDRQSEAPSGRTRFLVVALLTEQKGITFLLEAARLLLSRGLASFDLTIGGDGPERSKLEQQARALGVFDRCRFLGYLTASEVRRWMQQCDAFVLPSLHETFGIVLGEAMACGKPVIATHCGGADFVVTPETGVLVNPADPTALAGAMEDIILGRARYNPTVIRQSVIERFGEEAFLQRISASYEQIWAYA